MKLNTLSISDAEKLTPANIGKAFYERYAQRSKAFLEQGKLVYALSQKTLKAGQSIQSIITSKGVPTGSVDNARKAASLIEHLVVPGIVNESHFDKVATFRLCRNGCKLLGLSKKDDAVMTADQLGQVISENSKPAEIGNILDTWVEHGKSPEDHQADLKAQAQAQADAEAEAKKNAELVAKDDKEFDKNAEETPEETPEVTPEVTAEETAEETPVDDIAEKVKEVAPAVTVDAVLDDLFEVRISAMELDSEGMKAVLLSISEFQSELADHLNAHKKQLVEQAA
jgi:hypothetical protein